MIPSDLARSAMIDVSGYRRRQEAISLARVKRDAPAADLERRCQREVTACEVDFCLSGLLLAGAIQLENDFFRLQSQYDAQRNIPSTVRSICEGAAAALDSCLKDIYRIESTVYLDLPRSHPEYEMLGELQENLESELIAWKALLLLSNKRTQRSHRQPVGMSGSERPTEREFVDRLLKTEPVLVEFKALIDLLEESYSEYHPPELQLPSLKSGPVPPRLLLMEDLKRLNLKTKETQPKLTKSTLGKTDDEQIFEAIFRSFRAGDMDCANDIAKRGGLTAFAVNFYSCQYSNAAASDENRTGNGRLNWKSIAWKASEDKSLGRWQRAIWGILCGNYKAVLPVAEKWEDELWIYLKCFLDLVVEESIAQNWRGSSPPGLPPGYRESSLSRDDVLSRLQNSENAKIRAQSETVFRKSIVCALINDLPYAITEIENFISRTGAFCQNDSGISGGSSTNFRISCQVRFALHTLFLMDQADIAVDPKIVRLACTLYAQTTVGESPSLWAFYMRKIPEESRTKGASSIFATRAVTSELKVTFLRALFDEDQRCACRLSESFIRRKILPEQSTTKSTTEVLVGIFDVFFEHNGMTALLLAATNRTFRLFLLSEPPDAQSAADLALSIRPSLLRVFDQPDGVGGVDNFYSFKAEAICWKQFLVICQKFTEYNHQRAVEDDSRFVSDVSEYLQEIIKGGFQIMLLTDWLAGDNTADEPDRKNQLDQLRSLTLLQVYESVMEILEAIQGDGDEENQATILGNMMDLSAHLAERAYRDSLDLSWVKDRLSSVLETADRISCNPLDYPVSSELKEKIRTARTKIFNALKSV